MKLRARVRCLAVSLLVEALGRRAPDAAAQTSGAATEAPRSATDVVPPKLLSDAKVAYPGGAKGDALVILRLTVNADGTVRRAIPEDTNEPFSSQAAGAALDWIFEPARRNGQAIAANIRFEVAFHAEEAPPETPGDSAASANPYETPAPEPASSARPPPRPAGPPTVHEVVIRGSRPEPSRSATLSRAEVRQIPGTFGDPFRAIEIMPGVTPIVSGLPFFFVRGAPPGDVGYFLDGIKIPLLFHVGVGPSVIHPAIMERVDLYPGGYPARFGRFSGGIVSGETTAPATKIHGEYNARIFDAGAMVESPFAGNKGSFSVGGRYSYTAALLSLLASGVELNYWDYQARASYDLTPNDRIGFFSFGSYDYLGQLTSDQTITLFGTQFHRLDLRYDHRIGTEGNVRLAVTGGLDRTQLPNDAFLRDRLVGMRSELEYRLSSSVLVRAGTDTEIDAYDIELPTAQLGANTSAADALFPKRTDLTMGARADAVLELRPGFEITPGVRFDFYSSDGATAMSVDPRLATRLRLSEKMHLLSAMGSAHQPPAFVVPVPGFQPGGLRGGLQDALQESLGLEWEVDDSTTATATVFHNAFFNMSDPLSYQPPQLTGCVPGSLVDTWFFGERSGMGNMRCPTKIKTPGTLGGDGGGGQGAANAISALETRTLGTAYGLELFLKRKLTGRLGGFFSYTLSRSTRSVGRNKFTADFDRTHVINTALAYNLGRNWRAGTRVTFYTGLPKAADAFDSSTRLPPFFRVDLRLEKRWQLGERTWLSFVAEWMNATLSKEAVATTCQLQGCTAMTIGPVTIPSLGVEGGF